MNIQDIKALIEALQASDMTSFSYQKDGLKLKIEKNTAPVLVQGHKTNNSQQSRVVEMIETEPQHIVADSEQVKELAAVRVETVKEGTWTVSPLVGVYYGSPSPSSPSFVKVGDKVKKGDVLCIIEAMKVMNEITAEMDGEVLEIAAINESLVEFGQKLILIG